MGGGPLNPAEDLTLYWHKASNLPRGIPDVSIVTDFTKLDWWPADPPELRIDRTDIYPTLWIGTTSDVVLPNHFVYGANHVVLLPGGLPPSAAATLRDPEAKRPISDTLFAHTQPGSWRPNRVTKSFLNTHYDKSPDENEPHRAHRSHIVDTPLPSRSRGVSSVGRLAQSGVPSPGSLLSAFLSGNDGKDLAPDKGKSGGARSGRGPAPGMERGDQRGDRTVALSATGGHVRARGSRRGRGGGRGRGGLSGRGEHKARARMGRVDEESVSRVDVRGKGVSGKARSRGGEESKYGPVGRGRERSRKVISDREGREDSRGRRGGVDRGGNGVGPVPTSNAFAALFPDDDDPEDSDHQVHDVMESATVDEKMVSVTPAQPASSVGAAVSPTIVDPAEGNEASTCKSPRVTFADPLAGKQPEKQSKSRASSMFTPRSSLKQPKRLFSPGTPSSDVDNNDPPNKLSRSAGSVDAKRIAQRVTKAQDDPDLEQSGIQEPAPPRRRGRPKKEESKPSNASVLIMSNFVDKLRLPSQAQSFKDRWLSSGESQ